MAGRKLGVVTWTVENFSCWNKELHGEYIASPKFNFCAKLRVFPSEGVEGRVAAQVVWTRRRQRPAIPGELTWTTSDGIVIHRQDVNRDHRSLPVPSPTFAEVVARIRRDDRLVLRYEFEDPREFREQLCSAIGVFEAHFEMPAASLARGRIRAAVDYSRTKKPSVAYLRSVLKDGGGAELTLEMPGRRTPRCFVRASVRIARKNSFESREEKGHLFGETSSSWVVMDSREMAKEVVIGLRLRIVRGDVNKKYSVRLEEDLKDSVISEAIGDFSVCLPSEDPEAKSPRDLRLRCGDCTFSVHRNVLRDQSLVFETMLSNDGAMKSVDIEDVDASTLGHLLTYLYTGSAGDLSNESLDKLFEAGVKYQVASLEKEWDDHVYGNILKIRDGSDSENVATLSTSPDEKNE